MLLFFLNQDRSGRIKDATQSGPKSFAHSRRAVALKFDVRAMLYPSIVALLRCPKSLVHLESSGLPASGLLSYEHFNRRIITLLVNPGAPWIPN